MRFMIVSYTLLRYPSYIRGTKGVTALSYFITPLTPLILRGESPKDKN
jgi:hypothetical protein